MLELTRLRQDPQGAIEALAKRGLKAHTMVHDVLNLDEQRRKNQGDLDAALARSKAISKEIGSLFQQGKTDEAAALKEETARLKSQSKELQQEQEQLQQALHNLLTQLPNVPHAAVPAGSSEADNEEVARWGAMPHLPEGARPHWELAEAYGWIQFETGVKITGAGFPVYRGYGARLQRALINFFLDENREAGYDEYIPPFLVNEASGFGTGQLPDKEGQMYHVGADGLYAIPTAEVPLTNMFRDEILAQKELPLRCTAYSPCFRREAGSYGKDVRGLNRLHQFDKVEVINIATPAQSEALLQEMVDHVAGLLQKLNLPYRILRLCGGDLGFTAGITYDFEVWSAAQERWLEVSSVSNFDTFQSNRLKLRYRDEERKTHLCHTLNGSALALPRVMAALLENGQNTEGVVLPEALHSYCGFGQIPFEK